MEELKESMHSLESCYFDMDAACILEAQSATVNKPRIIKRETKVEKVPGYRHSTDAQFFNRHLLHKTLKDLGNFYDREVEDSLQHMGAVDEINKMLNAVESEEQRAINYIHSKENRIEYANVLNEHLIINRMSQRINKNGGWASFIAKYQEEKDDW